MITSSEVFSALRRRQTPAAENYHHNVYVIELDASVMKDRKFRGANKGCDMNKPCLYVGSTGLSPEERFKNHKMGYKANRFAKRYGLRLRPDLFAVYNPLPYKAAVELEFELAAALREEGYAIWQA